MQPFIGEIRLFGGNFSPKGWAFCSGQSMDIAQNQVLFAVIGTTYGGDGRSNFKIPNINARAVMGTGQARRNIGGQTTVLTKRSLGDLVGTELKTLGSQNLPQHNHTAVVSQAIVKIPVSTAAPTESSPEGNYLTQQGSNFYAGSDSSSQSYGPGSSSGATVTLASTGSSANLNNQQPFLGLRYIIAIEGAFPQRS